MTAPAPNPKDTPMTLDQKIRRVITERCKDADGGGDGYALNDYGAALISVLDLHAHRLLDEYSRETTDDSAAKYGRCDTCGNVSDGVYCPTVTVIAVDLAVTG